MQKVQNGRWTILWITGNHIQKGTSPKEAGLAWLKQHPDTCRKWLKDVTTVDGKDALPVFEAALANMTK